MAEAKNYTPQQRKQYDSRWAPDDLVWINKSGK